MSKVDIEKGNLINEKNRMLSDGEDVKFNNRLKSDTNWIPNDEESRILWIDYEIRKIDSIKTIYLNRKLINSLYGEICDGKTLFVY